MKRNTSSAAEPSHRLLVAEDVGAQRMVRVQDGLELVENGVAGVVPPSVDLIDDDVALLGDFLLRKGRMEGDVGDQLHRPLQSAPTETTP